MLPGGSPRAVSAMVEGAATASKNGGRAGHQWLFPGRRDQPLTTRQFGRLVQEAAKAAALR